MRWRAPLKVAREQQLRQRLPAAALAAAGAARAHFGAARVLWLVRLGLIRVLRGGRPAPGRRMRCPSVFGTHRRKQRRKLPSNSTRSAVVLPAWCRNAFFQQRAVAPADGADGARCIDLRSGVLVAVPRSALKSSLSVACMDSSASFCGLVAIDCPSFVRRGDVLLELEEHVERPRTRSRLRCSALSSSSAPAQSMVSLTEGSFLRSSWRTAWTKATEAALSVSTGPARRFEGCSVTRRFGEADVQV